MARLSALEILDSRGRPTLKVRCELASGAAAAASVPSGASTGAAEAHELRDGDPARHRGLGCRRAAAGVEGEIAAELVGVELGSQRELDARLVALDGTPRKGRLGANALLGVSLAFARALAAERGLPLWRHLAGDRDPGLPRPLVNLFSGGKHAGGQVAVQDVQLLFPHAAGIDAALAAVAEAFARGAELAQARYGMRLLRADEGGLAPPFADSEEMLAAAAGCAPGALLAVDVAASHFHADGRYELDGVPLTRAEMVERALRWLAEHPVYSLEDPLAEEDWEGWRELLARAPADAVLIGDDLLCTNPARIGRAVAAGAANALLLKPNQIGTLSEAEDAFTLARAAGWRVVVSARSGETEDDWLADLAVGWAADHIKVGSVTQSERLAKYNRLLEIERELA